MKLGSWIAKEQIRFDYNKVNAINKKLKKYIEFANYYKHMTQRQFRLRDQATDATHVPVHFIDMELVTS